MAGKSARRARRAAIEAGEAPEPTEEELAALEAEDEARSARRAQGAALGQRFVNWLNQGNRERESAMRMSDKEVPITYMASAFLAFIPIILIVGRAQWKGSHPTPIWFGAGVVLAVAAALSVRLRNRVLTPLFAIISVFLTSTGSSATPKSFRGLIDVDLVIGLGLTMWLTLRQSRARGAETAARRADQRAAKNARKGGKTPDPEPAVPRSARYTPPKGASTKGTSTRKR